MSYCLGCLTEIPRCPNGPTKEWCSKKCRYRALHPTTSYDLLQAVLQEIAPKGLTDECPARQRQAA